MMADMRRVRCMNDAEVKRMYAVVSSKRVGFVSDGITTTFACQAFAYRQGGVRGVLGEE